MFSLFVCDFGWRANKERAFDVVPAAVASACSRVTLTVFYLKLMPDDVGVAAVDDDDEAFALANLISSARVAFQLGGNTIAPTKGAWLTFSSVARLLVKLID